MWYLILNHMISLRALTFFWIWGPSLLYLIKKYPTFRSLPPTSLPPPNQIGKWHRVPVNDVIRQSDSKENRPWLANSYPVQEHHFIVMDWSSYAVTAYYVIKYSCYFTINILLIVVPNCAASPEDVVQAGSARPSWPPPTYNELLQLMSIWAQHTDAPHTFTDINDMRRARNKLTYDHLGQQQICLQAPISLTVVKMKITPDTVSDFVIISLS